MFLHELANYIVYMSEVCDYLRYDESDCCEDVK